VATLFDPLESRQQSDAAFLSASRRREIQNILKSYVGFFDPFSELIQNAMDAVDERQARLKELLYIRKLWIDINLQQNSFSVTDNGIGFIKQRFETFLAPNITYKSGSTSRGKKGVGATYLAYGFNFLQLGTKTPEYSIVANFEGGRNWVDSDGSTPEHRPVAVDADAIHDAYEEIDRGSTFTIKLVGDNVRPRDLAWLGATKADQWAAVLKIKTPLGHVSIDDPEDPNPITFSLRVTDAQGNVTEILDHTAEYVFPHEHITSCIDLDEILEVQRSRIAAGQDASKLPDKFRKLNGIYRFLSNEQILTLLESREPTLVELARKHRVTAYGFFCYSVKVWDQFNDDLLKLRKGQRILRGGLQLATDHMPQGDMLLIPLTSNLGYQAQAHVVVHLDDADPDLGRKGFQPELKSLGEEIAVAIVGVLKRWRANLKKDTGAAPSIITEGNLYDWVEKQVQHEKSNPLRITNPNFFIPINEISITAKPWSEQDVIVLFNQLIAGGIIRGIRLLATSQHEQYDSIYRFFVSEPMANHVFDKVTNPLGVQELSHAKEYLSRPYVLEYKYNVDALIHEFETEEKNERDINLVVAWDIGSEWKKRYNVTSLLDLSNIQHRLFHGLTHIFTDENTGDTRFYGTILSELIAYLENVDEVQAYHKATYKSS
jgi:hypothetical protein